ncbi:MAG: hypothetical protein AB7H97_06400 [Pseudobdellovibrionaceae bacterium]
MTESQLTEIINAAADSIKELRMDRRFLINQCDALLEVIENQEEIYLDDAVKVRNIHKEIKKRFRLRMDEMDEVEKKKMDRWSSIFSGVKHG